DGAISGLLLGRLRYPEQHSDGSHRQLRAEVGDEVEAPGAHQRIKGSFAERTDLGFQRAHLLRSEHPGKQVAMNGVLGWVLEDHDAGRHLDVRLDELEHGPACGAVGLTIHERPLHVVEAADGVEVVLRVVVEGYFLAKAPVHGVWIRVDGAVVRVVRERRRRSGHRITARRSPTETRCAVKVADRLASSSQTDGRASWRGRAARARSSPARDRGWRGRRRGCSCAREPECSRPTSAGARSRRPPSSVTTSCPSGATLRKRIRWRGCLPPRATRSARSTSSSTWPASAAPVRWLRSPCRSTTAPWTSTSAVSGSAPSTASTQCSRPAAA